MVLLDLSGEWVSALFGLLVGFCSGLTFPFRRVGMVRV